ncbi:MAG: ribose 5-phosphate isomerase B [Fimbriimonas sp.]
MNLVFGSDHAGYELRRHLADWAHGQGHTVTEVGSDGTGSYDYPDAADAGCNLLLRGEAELVVLVCGTGIGISIRANRHTGVRAALCTTELMARMARQHNFANALCLGSRILGTLQAESILQSFLDTPESTEARHRLRVDKLDQASAGSPPRNE